MGRDRKGHRAYEGSLSVEGTSGRHEPSLFTKRWSRRPWRLPHTRDSKETREGKTAERRAKARRDLVKEGEATEVSEARSKRAPWEENAHALVARAPETMHEQRGAIFRQRVSSYSSIRRSVHECRETLGPPVNRVEPKTPRGSPRRKPWSEPGTHEVRVHADRSGGRSRSDASRVLSSAGSQGSSENQGASPKEARSTA